MSKPSAAQAPDTADFGFSTVAREEKQKKVRAVFDGVAGRYDLMNDLMSMGMHRGWKDKFVAHVSVHAPQRILDVAGGTGDIARRLFAKTRAPITVCDINHAMLKEGIHTRFDKGESEGLSWVCGNAEALPLPDACVDVYTIAFGLRNVTNKDVALREAYRVLRPGGQFLCLEFSPVENGLLKPLYDAYSFHAIPRMGGLVAGDRAAYQYLVESIRMFPNVKTLEKMCAEAGFSRVKSRTLSGGIVAIHEGWHV